MRNAAVATGTSAERAAIVARTTHIHHTTSVSYTVLVADAVLGNRLSARASTVATDSATISVSVSATIKVTATIITMIPLAVSAIVEITIATIVSVVTRPIHMSVVMTATSHAGRTVARSSEVTTIPAIVHTYMMIVMSTIVVAVSVIVTMPSMAMPSVSTTIGSIEVRTPEVEVLTMRVAQIDAEVPVTCLPVEWAIEIAGGYIGVPLPIVKDITQVEITTLPVGAEHVCTSCHSHEIVKINLVGCLVLLVIQIQLVGHLVGQKQGFVASLLITHGVGGSANCHHHQCEKQLLHNRIVLNC